MSGRQSIIKRILYLFFAWGIALPVLAIVGFNMQTLTLDITAMMLPYFKSFVLMFSALVSATFSADMFAGEKERRTIESYLALPVSEQEIIFAKILVPMFFGALTPVIYLSPTTFTIDIGFVITQGMRVFDVGWYLTLFILSPLVALTNAQLGIRISTHFKTTKAASNFTGFTATPFIVLVFTTIFFPSLWTMGFILILISIIGVLDLLLYTSIKNGFDMERLVLDLD